MLASVALKQSSASAVAVVDVQDVVGGSVIVSGAQPVGSVGVQLPVIPASPPVPVPVPLVDALDPALVPALEDELDIVTPVQNPDIFALASCVVQFAPPAVTTFVHIATELDGSVLQHAERVSQSGFTVPPPSPVPATGVLELLQAAAVMDAAKKTGMARRYRLMAGHHTRPNDRVKMIGAVLRTKTYEGRHRVSRRPAPRERYRRALRMLFVPT